MSLISFSYIVFLLFLCILYYSFKKVQKVLLLGGSIFFYVLLSTSFDWKRLLLLILSIWFLTYFSALLIERNKGVKKKIALWLALFLLLSILFVLKYAFNLLISLQTILHFNGTFSAIHFASVVGMSYYTLSAIGYLVEVYWGNIPADKNIVNVGLFIFFFPQLISGPFTRYSSMQEQFNTRYFLRYDRFTNGMRRMLWGYFQKLVLSTRFALIVSSVYTNAESSSGTEILFASLCYAVQLYTDFSGCMDIIMGTSMLFGITLPENFNAPFYSETIQEFWQRWHITLGLWFKDFVMYPLQKTAFMQRVGKIAKRYFGKKYGRKVPFHLSMLVLWFLIGIWHGGTGYYFIASAFIPCVLLLSADVFREFISHRTEVRFSGASIKLVQIICRLRTQILLCMCWVFVNAQSTPKGIGILRHSLIHPGVFSFKVWGILAQAGLSKLDVALLLLGTFLLWVIDYIRYQGSTVYIELDKRPLYIRVLAVYGLILFIMLFGKFGASSFIYFQF